jgi:hypothetical protein
MKFGHLEQKFEISNQNMCKKFLKNNAHMLIFVVVTLFEKIFFRQMGVPEMGVPENQVFDQVFC